MEQVSAVENIIDEEFARTLIYKLTDWFEKNKRILPWRSNPTPYHVWVSEIMLQQTRVEAVKGYYDRFLSVLPDIKALADADMDVLLKLWEGLGYYNRVRNMQKAAQTIMEEYDGEFPDTYEEIVKLKGIGEYTAGAIASIAFLEAVPAVDGNVLRVISRITGSRKDIGLSGTKKEIRELLNTMVPLSNPASFNQGLMELGALICVPNGTPKCSECPLSSLCSAYQEALTDVIPVKEKKVRRRVEEKTVLLLLYEGEGEPYIGITKRPETGLLSGMWQFPLLRAFSSSEEVKKQLGLTDCSITEATGAKHIFSHIEWQMRGRLVLLKKLPKELLIEEQRIIFVPYRELKEHYALPSAFQVYKHLLEERYSF